MKYNVEQQQNWIRDICRSIPKFVSKNGGFNNDCARTFFHLLITDNLTVRVMRPKQKSIFVIYKITRVW